MEESTMVLESAKPRLKNLAKVADRLNKASDQYTEELKKIEAELNALNLGLEVTLDESIRVSDSQIDYDENGEPRATYQIAHYLGYVKRDWGWGLHVLEYKELLDGDRVYDATLEGTTPLQSSSRELRIASANHILDLLDLLEKEAEKKIASLEKVSDARKS